MKQLNEWIPSKECIATLKKFPVTTTKFSLALLKAKCANMDTVTFDRAMKTMICLAGKRPFDEDQKM
jgi:hypothetical protein